MQISAEESVFCNGRINLVGPRKDAALQVKDFAETRLTQEVHGLRGTLPAAAMRDNFLRRIEFMYAPGQLPERKQMSLEITELVLVRLAHIENEQIISTIEPGFELARSDLRHLHGRAGSFFAAYSAEFVVIDQLGNRRMRSAHRAVRILAQLELAEFHPESVKKQQASHEIFPAAEDQLDRFHRLDGADDSGQNAEDAAFRARRHKSRRRRFRIEAAVARTIGHAKNGGLPFKPENRTVHVWLPQQDTCVINKIPRGEIVSPIDDDVEVLEEFERVGAGQLRFERLDLNVWIEVRKARARGFALRLAYVAGAKRNLTLEIGEVDDIKVYQPEFAHARGRKVQAKWCAEPARADEQYLGVLQLELPLHANFRHDEVPAVAKNFFVRKARRRFCAGLRLCGCGHCVSLLLQIPIRLGGTISDRKFLAKFNAAPPGTATATLNIPPRDGRNNTDRVSIFRGRIFFRQVANVLIIHVYVDEAAQLAVFGEEMFAQFGEFRGQMAERFPDSPCTELGRVTLSRVGAKRRGDHYFHGHFISPLC